MDDAARAQALKAVEEQVEKTCQALEPFYAAKQCPRDFHPCRGPRCMLFLPEATLNEQTGKPVLTGGSCAIAVLASQVGPIGNDLIRLIEMSSAPGGSHIIQQR
jgi:hypothetical protein